MARMRSERAMDTFCYAAFFRTRPFGAMIRALCLLPQSRMAAIKGSSVRPCAVSWYSTVTGTVAFTVRDTSWFCSRSRSSLLSIFGVMVPMSLTSSLKRDVPFASKVRMINTFHLPESSSTVSRVGRISEMHLIRFGTLGKCFMAQRAGHEVRESSLSDTTILQDTDI